MPFSWAVPEDVEGRTHSTIRSLRKEGGSSSGLFSAYKLIVSRQKEMFFSPSHRYHEVPLYLRRLLDDYDIVRFTQMLSLRGTEGFVGFNG